ncbi:tissue factor pathway inhibitor 2 [Engraulis encrasicolus]|uniref:tissue factor pathway inhibitor 2 n=1 Tax=Engraulis encrasicolus TaxID=184585 RepID=UPI002FD05074
MEYYLCALTFLHVALRGNVLALKPKDVCFLEVDEGPCRGDKERFFYNRLTQECEAFSYGGCLGNANNFNSLIECRKTCSTYKIPAVPRICRFEKDEGPCRALLKRYFYNMTSMQCEIFYYGGCEGNENKFSSLQSCLEYCKPQKNIPLMCRDPMDKGRCSASIPRFYFNSATKMCEQFEYTGCGGSSNNFVTRQACTDVCGKAVKPPSGKIRMKSRVVRTRYPAAPGARRLRRPKPIDRISA